MNLYNSTAALLISIAKADEIIEDKELDIINDILIDFFNINEIDSKRYIEEGMELFNNSTDLFKFGQMLNSNLNYKKKIQFILSIFNVAFCDNELHDLEYHTIKKIANILNVEHQDLISAKIEMKKILN